MYSLTERSTIKYLCDKYGFHLKKAFGQNFINDEGVLYDIAEATDSEGIIEIGPGIGALTAVLASRAKKVVAVEIDDTLMPVLGETLAGFDNIEIINDDIMKIDINKLITEKFDGMSVSVAANLPYYITTPIIMKLLEEKTNLSEIVVMMQKEVADRLTAKEGGKDYGAITVAANYYCEVERVCFVPSSVFTPPPKVDSSVVKLKIRKEPPFEVLCEKTFFSVVKASFAQRRKTLSNGLKNAGIFGTREDIEKAFEACKFDSMIRGEKLSGAEFAKLANYFYEKKQKDIAK